MNENITKYLNAENMETLHESEGYIMLVRKPAMLEQLKRSKMAVESSLSEQIKIKEERDAKALAEAKAQKKGIFESIKGLFSRKEKVEAPVESDPLTESIARLKDTVARHEEGILALQSEIDEFIEKIKAEGLVSEEVVATYYALKEEIEKQERIASEERTRRHEEAAAEAARLAPIPAQNTKAHKTMSQREKFARRMAITAQKTGKPESTPKQKQ